MKKPATTTPTKLQHDIAIMRDRCKDIAIGFTKEGTKKASFSIICQYDDKSILDKKITVRDSRVDQFNDFFDSAVSLAPDYILVKYYTGEGVQAIEIGESENLIRISPKSNKPPKREKAVLAGPPQAETPGQVEILRMDFDHKLEKERNENANKFILIEKDRTIEKLEGELKAEQALHAKALANFKELEEKHGELKRRGGMTLEGIATAGLSALGNIASKNPKGSLLGLIPNATLAGFFGKESDSPQLEGASDSQREVYYDQIVAFCSGLTDAEFDQLFSVFGFMSNDRANIAKTFELIQKSVSQNKEIKSV